MITTDEIIIDGEHQKTEQDGIESGIGSKLLETLKTKIEIIDGIGFHLESSACPLVYGLYKNDVKIGYFYERRNDIICEVSYNNKQIAIKIPSMNEQDDDTQYYLTKTLKENPDMPKDEQEEIQNRINKILSDRLSKISEEHHPFATDIFHLGLKQATANLVNTLS